MKRTIITVGGNGMLSIPSNLENLWMSESELVDIHTSGHAARECIQKVIDIVKPKEVICIHTEAGAEL